MRKITSEACHALQSGYRYKSGNTEVIAGLENTTMYLHGHAIAKISTIRECWKYSQPAGRRPPPRSD